MPTHESQSSGFQSQTGSPRTNPFAPRPFEAADPEEQIALSSKAPFAPRPHEVWMGKQPLARKPDSTTSERQTEPQKTSVESAFSRFSIYPPRQTPPSPTNSSIQAKLTVGQPDDAYEQEADRVAEQVMSMAPPVTPPIQRQAEEEQGEIQTKSLAETITPLIQRQAIHEDEELLQAKCETCEQDEQIQRSVDRATQAQPYLESRLNASKGGGNPLPDEVRGFMEPRFRADFSQVRVHTGSEAVQMNQELNAQAFAHGRDIFFGAGKAPGKDALTAHELTHVVQQNSVTSKIQRDEAKDESEASPAPATHKVKFVYEEGLNLRTQAEQKSASLAQLKFGQKVHTLGEPEQGWQKVLVLGQVGYVRAASLHPVPDDLIQQDPGLSLIKVKPGETFWGLVKSVYGIQGNEGDYDQNINHFINAIRAVNKPEAFNIKTDTLDDFGNSLIPGRDASDTYLKAGVNLWIPSFHVAAHMNVGSGTVTGEVSRFIKNIEQRIEDFGKACHRAGDFIPGAIAKHAGEMGEALLEGLIQFAKEAAIILAASTAVGALIGAVFGGGVGAIPGAEIGFELGLIILEAYGLYALVETVMGLAGGLLSQLGQFIKLVWNANGDKKQIDLAAKSLADALGILVSAVLMALAAYLMHKGFEAFGKTKFAKIVGEQPLMKWFKERQQLKTTKEKLKGTEPEKRGSFSDSRSEPLSQPTMLQRQRAVALEGDAARLEQQASRLDKQAERMMSSSNPKVHQRANEVRRQAGELRAHADDLREQASQYRQGRGATTDVVPEPHEFDEAFERLLTEGSSDSNYYRSPLEASERTPETLQRISREVMRSRTGNRVVFRVQGGGGRPGIIQIESGTVTVNRPGSGYLHLNFGSEERAFEFLKNNRSGGEIVAFEVDENWVQSLRSSAIPQRGTGDIPNTPRLVDVRMADDQLELPVSLLDELEEFIIPGSGRVLATE